MESTRTVDLSTNSIIVVLLVFGTLWFLWAVRDVAVLLGLCVVLAAALHPLIQRLKGWGIPAPVGILSLYAVLFSIVAIVVTTFVPLIIDQLHQLALTLLSVWERIGQGTSARSAISGAIAKVADGSVHALSTGTWHALSFISISSLWVLVGAILVYQLVVDHGSFRRSVAGMIPRRMRGVFLEESTRLEHRLNLWLRGVLTVGLVIAVLAGVGLTLLHVKDALVLALIAGLSEFVPLIGPYIAMIPAAAVGFSISPLTGLLVIALYYGIQQVENNFVAPKVVSQAVGLRPVVVFLAILVGAKAAGILGIMLAVPGVIVAQSLFVVVQATRHTQPAPS